MCICVYVYIYIIKKTQCRDMELLTKVPSIRDVNKYVFFVLKFFFLLL